MNKDKLIKKIQEQFPCFGHFSVMHCENLGYRKLTRNRIGALTTSKCPFENECRKILLKYLKDSDPYNDNQIDKPRDWIRQLEKRS
jgi:hypothetical protein